VIFLCPERPHSYVLTPGTTAPTIFKYLFGMSHREAEESRKKPNRKYPQCRGRRELYSSSYGRAISLAPADSRRLMASQAVNGLRKV
jgi:hypothetical protein